MVPPGATVTPLSVLSTDRSGDAVIGVVSVAVLSAGVGSGPLPPSSATAAVLVMLVTPLATGEMTVTANVAVRVAPPATVPMGSVQLVATQDQPTVEPAALNVVLAGTVSVSTTPVAAWFPVFR